MHRKPMMRPPTTAKLQSVPNTADAWAARLSAADVTDADRAAFEAWIAKSQENRAEYELSALVLDLARGLPAAENATVDIRNTRSFAKGFRPLLAAAAVATLAIGMAFWWHSFRP